MSGGAPQRGDCVLDYIYSMKETEQQLAVKQQQLSAVEHELRSVSAAAEQWNQLAQQLELRQHELEMSKLPTLLCRVTGNVPMRLRTRYTLL
jgi:chromosome segregation ATPase